MHLALLGGRRFRGILNQFGILDIGISTRWLNTNWSGGLMEITAESAGTAFGTATVLPYKINKNEYEVSLNSRIDNLNATATGRGLVSGDTLADLLDVGVTNYNGLVNKAIDQTSNNRHFVQTNLANMPKIATSGVIETLNGKPTITFSSATYLDLSGFTLTQPASGFLVYETSTITRQFLLSKNAATGDKIVFIINNTDTEIFAGAFLSIATTNPTNPKQAFFLANGASSQIDVLGEFANGDAGIFESVGLRIGADGDASDQFIGKCSEILLDRNNLLSVKDGYNNNQQNYYGVS